MCTFKITSDPLPRSGDLILQRGGPTLSNTVEVDGVFLTHHLLNVTGEITPQPVQHDGKYFMLLGEIYNYEPSLGSDIHTAIAMHSLYGDTFTDCLDGEFLIIVYDPTEQTIDLYTDPWSTRQVFYYESKNKKHFTFSTFPDKEIGRFEGRPHAIIDPQRLLHNSHYRYHIADRKLIHVNGELHKWSLDQHVDSIEPITEAFEAAVKKRYHEQMVLYMSGGVDSVAIALCLADWGKPFTTLTVLIKPEVEDIETINDVYEYIKTVATCHVMDQHPVNPIRGGQLNKRKLPLHAGLQYEIREVTKAIMPDCKVVLTGNGADEILTNYQSASTWTWPHDLSTIFPWTHFYHKVGRRLIDYHELISLNYGLEQRSVFYDKAFCQAWLNLAPEFKNVGEKFFLKKYLANRKIHIPFTANRDRKAMFRSQSD